MGLQTAATVLGIGKQTDKDTIATQPAFAHGVSGGGITVDINQEADELTSAQRAVGSVFRDRVENGAEIPTRAFVKSIGLYLLGVMGSVATTGAGPYTHVFTLGSTLPYLTVFEKIGAAIQAVKGCKLEELSLEWDENKPLEITAKFNGTKLSFPVSFTPTVDEVDSDVYFTPVGGTFKLDVDSAVPVTAYIKSGKITWKNGTEPQFFSGDIEAGDVEEKKHEVEVSFTIVPDDLAPWRTVVTGSAAGAAPSSTPVIGSFEHTFIHGTNSLKLEAGKCAFLCDFPEAEPDGGSAELELSGICLNPGANSAPCKATLINQQATY